MNTTKTDTLPVVRVYDLRSDAVKVYVGITPRMAVICAYAQAKGDSNTWDYERRYGPLVREGENTIACGDWCALKTGARLGS